MAAQTGDTDSEEDGNDEEDKDDLEKGGNIIRTHQETNGEGDSPDGSNGDSDDEENGVDNGEL
jgi:hypothetical protein